MAVATCDYYKIKFKAIHLMDILREISALGTIELEEPSTSNQTVIQTFASHREKIEKQLLQYHNLIHNVSQIQPDTQTKQSSTDPTKNLIVADHLLQALEQTDQQVEIINKQLDQLHTLENQKTDLTQQLDQLSPFQHVNLSILQTSLDQWIHTALLVANSEKFSQIENYITDIEGIVMQTLETTEKQTVFLLFYDLDHVKDVEKIIKQLNLLKLETTQSQINPAEKFRTLQTQQQLVNTQIADIKKQLFDRYHKIHTQIEQLIDILKWELEAVKSIKYVKTTKSKGTMELSGWIDKHQFTKTKHVLSKIDEKIKFKQSRPNIGSSDRAILSNKSLFRPFEMVTKLLGQPSSQEIDPSPIVAPFFVLFFGFALGDGGYGVLMVLAAIYLLTKKKIKSQAKDAVKLLLYCGASTVFFGLITGSWFGVNVSHTDAGIGIALKQFKLIDVQSSILTLIIATLVIGFLQQILGLILEGVTYWKNQQYAEAILKPGTWILFLGTLIMSAMSSTLKIDMPSWIYIPVLIIFGYGQGDPNKNTIIRTISGMGSIFNITGFLSNTLSYVRLIALGLATGVIASVVNLLAFTFGGGGFGIVITILILVIGHTFNIAMNLLGSFINVLRLQLVEFFPRFFNAKGIALKPINWRPEWLEYRSQIGYQLRPLNSWVQ